MSIYFDWQAALIGKSIRIGQDLKIAALELLGGILGRTAIKGGVARLPLREFNGIESGAVALLEEEQVARVVNHADRNSHGAALCFRLGGGDHRFDGAQIQEFLRG